MKPISRREALSTGAFGLSSLLSFFALKPSIPALARGNAMPEFEGIEAWLNSDPLTVKDLEGQVVAVQFWTFGCINCIRTLPHITSLYSKYRDDNFTLIGVHTPEFPYERSVNNVRDALGEHGIKYPVAIDNQYKTWRAYENRYWPHIFLADKSGQLRFHHIGEGAYEATDRRVAQLLAESV